MIVWIIRGVVFILALLDMILTHLHLKRCLRLGFNDYNKIEKNPLFIMCWNILGINKGSLLASGIILTLVLILSLLTNIYWNIFYVIIYLIAIINHIVVKSKLDKNFQQ